LSIQFFGPGKVFEFPSKNVILQAFSPTFYQLLFRH